MRNLAQSKNTIHSAKSSNHFFYAYFASLLKVMGLIMVCIPILADAQLFDGKRIFYVNSYQTDSEVTNGVTKGILEVLEDNNVEMEIFYMDTKHHSSEAEKQAAALQAKKLIEEFKPDVVIAAEDDAAKYLIMPYYKDADLPFVFCGINWDASMYGFPYENVTGILETDSVSSLVTQLVNYAHGDKVGFIALDGMTERKIVDMYNKILHKPVHKTYFVTTFADWKTSFLAAQSEVDILLVSTTTGIEDWNDEESIDFVEQNSKIPTGTVLESRMPLAMVGFVKIPEEQGIWAAQTALKILTGTKPSAIPIAKNKLQKILFNLRLSKKAGITFKPDLLRLGVIVP